jgi:hypothetical protein
VGGPDIVDEYVYSSSHDQDPLVVGSQPGRSIDGDLVGEASGIQAFVDVADLLEQPHRSAVA